MIRAVKGLACALLMTACSEPTDTDAAKNPVTLNVYAASSLKGAFTELGRTFESEHDGTKVVFTYGGSSDLVAQIAQGAPADVFASADESTMAKLADERLIAGTSQAFASNTLQIAVPANNPANVKGLTDLASPHVDVVACTPEVPCGSAAKKVAQAARLIFHTVSEEQNVTDVLNKVVAGEAEAGLVYVTDVKAAGDAVKGIPFPEAADAVNIYPIAAVKTSRHPAESRAFADLVLSAKGRDVLRHAGFARP